jgi:release factor glutamine methyltransferase
LDFYRILAKEAPDYLRNNGIILLETGFDQGQDVTDILRNNGFKNIEVIIDLSGKDRVVKGMI